MARPKKVKDDDKELGEALDKRISDYMSRPKKFDTVIGTIQPKITSITINPNGTIFGLADNVVYRYDDINRKWVL